MGMTEFLFLTVLFAPTLAVVAIVDYFFRKREDTKHER